MAEVKILIVGWTNADSREKGEEESSACTTTLIRDGEIVAVVDPGVLADQQILIDALAKEGLKIADVTHIFITHSHIDHYRNVGMFPAGVPVVEYWGEWIGNKSKSRPRRLGENIEIIKTPGHSLDSLSFIVKTQEGIIAIVGDVFWKEYSPEKDPYASDQVELEKSREIVLGLADFIIPGHSKMFKVN